MKAITYIVPPIALKGYQALTGSRGAGSVRVSFVSLFVIKRTDSPKNVIVTQPKCKRHNKSYTILNIVKNHVVKIIKESLLTTLSTVMPQIKYNNLRILVRAN